MTMSPNPIVWSKDPIWCEIETDLISGGEASEPNLSCYVQVYNALLSKFIAELNAPYSLFNGKTDFDLSGFDLVEPEAPDDALIGATGTTVCYKAAGIYRLRYNDMFGTPAGLPETLLDSANFAIIYGHTPYWYGIGDTAKDTLLHSYFTPDGHYAIKEIRKGQDEYVYIHSFSGAALLFYFEIIYTDGSSTTTPNQSWTVAKDYVNCMNIGWNVMNMDTVADATKTVQSYVLHITIGGEDKIIIYALDDHDTEYDEYLLYDNGIGGCEVLRCSGRHTINVESQKEYLTRSRSRGTNFRDGFSAAHNVSGAEVWELNTGYQSDHYMRHIAQLFLAEKVWYIDRLRGKFINVTVRDTGKLLIDKDSGLHSMTFNMRFDDRPALGTLNI